MNWCPKLGTVLANEEVINGLSEVGDHPVEKRYIKQWVLKITKYAEELLSGLDDLDWPESTKDMQRNWIGKSVGATIKFKIASAGEEEFECFSTRPDTLFGATFCVLAPEHSLVKTITTPEQKDAINQYVLQAAEKSELERTSTDRDKTGAFTGAYAINPINQERIPVYIADYVYQPTEQVPSWLCLGTSTRSRLREKIRHSYPAGPNWGRGRYCERSA